MSRIHSIGYNNLRSVKLDKIDVRAKVLADFPNTLDLIDLCFINQHDDDDVNPAAFPLLTVFSAIKVRIRHHENFAELAFSHTRARKAHRTGDFSASSAGVAQCFVDSRVRQVSMQELVSGKLSIHLSPNSRVLAGDRTLVGSVPGLKTERLADLSTLGHVQS